MARPRQQQGRQKHEFFRYNGFVFVVEHFDQLLDQYKIAQQNGRGDEASELLKGINAIVETYKISDHPILLQDGIMNWNVLCQCSFGAGQTNNRFNIAETPDQYKQRMEATKYIIEKFVEKGLVQIVALQEATSEFTGSLATTTLNSTHCDVANKGWGNAILCNKALGRPTDERRSPDGRTLMARIAGHKLACIHGDFMKQDDVRKGIVGMMNDGYTVCGDSNLSFPHKIVASRNHALVTRGCEGGRGLNTFDIILANKDLTNHLQPVRRPTPVVGVAVVPQTTTSYAPQQVAHNFAQQPVPPQPAQFGQTTTTPPFAATTTSFTGQGVPPAAPWQTPYPPFPKLLHPFQHNSFDATTSFTGQGVPPATTSHAPQQVASNFTQQYQQPVPQPPQAGMYAGGGGLVPSPSLAAAASQYQVPPTANSEMLTGVEYMADKRSLNFKFANEAQARRFCEFTKQLNEIFGGTLEVEARGLSVALAASGGIGSEGVYIAKNGEIAIAFSDSEKRELFQVALGLRVEKSKNDAKQVQAHGFTHGDQKALYLHPLLMELRREFVVSVGTLPMQLQTNVANVFEELLLRDKRPIETAYQATPPSPFPNATARVQTLPKANKLIHRDKDLLIRFSSEADAKTFYDHIRQNCGTDLPLKQQVKDGRYYVVVGNIHQTTTRQGTFESAGGKVAVAFADSRTRDVFTRALGLSVMVGSGDRLTQHDHAFVDHPDSKILHFNPQRLPVDKDTKKHHLSLSDLLTPTAVVDRAQPAVTNLAAAAGVRRRY